LQLLPLKTKSIFTKKNEDMPVCYERNLNNKQMKCFIALIKRYCLRKSDSTDDKNTTKKVEFSEKHIDNILLSKIKSITYLTRNKN
jgi:hypothetical protein